VFVAAARPHKALVAYERALAWRELFDLALSNPSSSASFSSSTPASSASVTSASSTLPLSEEEVREMAYRIAEDLGGKKRHGEAARVLLDYCGNVRGAVSALVEGSEWGEARRVVSS
jgi:elongator complex protein 1